MSTPRVCFEAVGKKFRRGGAHDSLRDLVPALVRRVLKAEPRDDNREFWALRDISFTVEPGQTLGIIGANGAGKSTTLKILNRIMEPTTGNVDVRGRIGALIEVAAGFHPDLTGRQNVFLQGAIIGMRRREVQEKFSDIVDFSGISAFIDTPVKRYSSGMNARLGFSIAAHLEPEVLIIDEVLAVGDFAFQAKAFARIKEMAKSGAPVVLVSHQLDRISELCDQVMLLERGSVKAMGPPQETISAYMSAASESHVVSRYGEIGLRFAALECPKGTLALSGEGLSLRVKGETAAKEWPTKWTPIFRVANAQSGAVIHSVLGRSRSIPMPVSKSFEWDIELQMNVPPGAYSVDVGVYDIDDECDVFYGPRCQLEVVERNRFWGDVQLNVSWSERQGAASRSR
jgi:ABC-type polysaccharide/polyol phosphate transport system ATPase subunit